MKIGIVGLGFVGSAIAKSFEEKGICIFAKYDKFKEKSYSKNSSRKVCLRSC